MEKNIAVNLTTEVKTIGIGKMIHAALVINVDGKLAHRQWFSTIKDAEAARASVAGILWVLKENGFLDTDDIDKMKQMTRQEEQD